MRGLVSCAALVMLTIAPACASDQERQAVEVPMDLSTGRPVISVMINGQGPFDFVLDTGMPGGGIFSAGTIEALGLEATGQTRIGSPLGGEPVLANQYRIDSLAVGEAVARDFTSTSIVDDPMAGAVGDGVIGPSLFDGDVVTMDFTNNTLRIGGDVPESVTWIPFGESAPLLDAIVSIGDVDLPAHIDSGAPQTLGFPADTADILPLDGPVEVIGRGRTIDKEFEILGAPLKAEAKVGDAIIPLERVTFAPLPVVNIGTGALRGLVLTIDWPNERFALTGRAEPVILQPRRVVVQGPAEE